MSAESARSSRFSSWAALRSCSSSSFAAFSSNSAEARTWRSSGPDPYRCWRRAASRTGWTAGRGCGWWSWARITVRGPSRTRSAPNPKPARNDPLVDRVRDRVGQVSEQHHLLGPGVRRMLRRRRCHRSPETRRRWSSGVYTGPIRDTAPTGARSNAMLTGRPATVHNTKRSPTRPPRRRIRAPWRGRVQRGRPRRRSDPASRPGDPHPRQRPSGRTRDRRGRRQPTQPVKPIFVLDFGVRAGHPPPRRREVHRLVAQPAYTGSPGCALANDVATQSITAAGSPAHASGYGGVCSAAPMKSAPSHTVSSSESAGNVVARSTVNDWRRSPGRGDTAGRRPHGNPRPTHKSTPPPRAASKKAQQV